MSEYTDLPPHNPRMPGGLPPAGDPPPLPGDADRDPINPDIPPIDEPMPSHEPNDPQPGEPPHVNDPLPPDWSPAGDPPNHPPAISI